MHIYCQWTFLAILCLKTSLLCLHLYKTFLLGIKFCIDSFVLCSLSALQMSAHCFLAGITNDTSSVGSIFVPSFIILFFKIFSLYLAFQSLTRMCLHFCLVYKYIYIYICSLYLSCLVFSYLFRSVVGSIKVV